MLEFYAYKLHCQCLDLHVPVNCNVPLWNLSKATIVVGRCLHFGGFQYIVVSMAMCTWATKDNMLPELCLGEKVFLEIIASK